eukprot:GABV01002443.1.p1 GENE.GABV01002443.1~~GABV01002443.1.p1  ORF type:complete len:127 (+),score=24.79 GABV01002443.1:254-634(+)
MRQIASNFVAKAVGRNDGHFIDDFLVDMKIKGQTSIVALDDLFGGVFDKLVSDSALHARFGNKIVEEAAKKPFKETQINSLPPLAGRGSAPKTKKKKRERREKGAQNCLPPAIKPSASERFDSGSR